MLSLIEIIFPLEVVSKIPIGALLTKLSYLSLFLFIISLSLFISIFLLITQTSHINNPFAP